MRSLTDEAKEIVRVFMADGKVATRKMIAEQVEKNISRPNEYRVNILNGVIKVMTENHEWDVVERGKYQLGKGLPKRTPEELAVLYLMDCKKNMGSLCSIDETETSEDKRDFIMRVADSVSEIDKLLLKFNGGKVEVEKTEPKEVEKKEQDKAEKPVEEKKEPAKEEKKQVEPKAVEKAVEKTVEKKEEAVKAVEAEKKEEKPVEKKEVTVEKKEETEKKEEAGKKEEAPVKEPHKEEVKAPGKKAETAKKEKEAPVKKEGEKKAEPAKKVENKKLEVPAVVKKEEQPKTEIKTEDKAVEKTA